MRAGPAVGEELFLEIALSFRQFLRVVETFGSLAAICVDDAQFVTTLRQIPDFISHKLPAPLEPPEHRILQSRFSVRTGVGIRWCAGLCNVRVP